MSDRSTLINYAEVLQDIEKLEQTVPEGFSIFEMSSSLGKSEKWCRDKMRVLINAKKARYNGKKLVTNICGNSYKTNVYVLI